MVKLKMAKVVEVDLCMTNGSKLLIYLTLLYFLLHYLQEYMKYLAAFWDAFICKFLIREIEKHKYEIEGADIVVTFLVIFNFFK